jgi:molybdopterin-guanine dinucleotide biosynthesis protein A
VIESGGSGLRTPPATAIVLAGGRSSRFGRDKLVEPIDGRPLLHHTLIAVSAVVRDIVIVLAPDAPPPDLPEPRGFTAAVRFVRDPEAFGGPLAALGAAIDWAAEPLALVVGGDMPGLQPEVLSSMLRALEAGHHDAVILAQRGRRHPLPAAVRVGAATSALRGAVADGDRALLALFDRLSTRALDDWEWRPFDPEGRTLRDIDTPADLGANSRSPGSRPTGS